MLHKYLNIFKILNIDSRVLLVEEQSGAKPSYHHFKGPSDQLSRK